MHHAASKTEQVTVVLQTKCTGVLSSNVDKAVVLKNLCERVVMTTFRMSVMEDIRRTK